MIYNILFTIPLHYYTGEKPKVQGNPWPQRSSSYKVRMTVECEDHEIQYVAKDLAKKFQATSLEVFTHTGSQVAGLCSG